MTERDCDAPMLTAIGLMSGTSADGVDAALLRTDGVRIEAFGPHATTPMPPALRRDILALMADPARAEHGDLRQIEADITDFHRTAVTDLLAQAGLAAAQIDVVGFHGQTVLHRPDRRLTRQLGDGALLAQQLGIAVVNRFRHADVAAGGQGAPLVPLFHAALAHDLERPLAVLNLGGIGNVTWLGHDAILAFDTGPANALIDDWMRQHCGLEFDADGAIAARGVVREAALATLLDNAYFARRPPKSLDRHDFSATYLSNLSADDGAATLTAFTALCVAQAQAHMPEAPGRWLVAGGGRHNATLMRALLACLAVPVEPVETQGWNGDALEAQAFAFLAVRALHGLPLSLPSTTGVPKPMPGGTLHKP